MIFIKNIFCGLLLLLALTHLCSGYNTKMCGVSLNQALDVLCVDGFNYKNLRSKKSDMNVKGIAEPSALSALFMNGPYADYNNLMAKTRRRRFNGIVDECCLKSCTLSELLSYCL